MIRDRQGRTECQTLALPYLVSSAARSALPLSGSKLICANTSTDASSSKSKDYYYYYPLLIIPQLLQLLPPYMQAHLQSNFSQRTLSCMLSQNCVTAIFITKTTPTIYTCTTFTIQLLLLIKPITFVAELSTVTFCAITSVYYKKSHHLPSSQNCPLKPSVQLQVYSVMPSTQVPLTQSLVSQSSISASR